MYGNATGPNQAGLPDVFTVVTSTPSTYTENADADVNTTAKWCGKLSSERIDADTNRVAPPLETFAKTRPASGPPDQASPILMFADPV